VECCTLKKGARENKHGEIVIAWRLYTACIHLQALENEAPGVLGLQECLVDSLSLWGARF
jgi:hypothetical protein